MKNAFWVGLLLVSTVTGCGSPSEATKASAPAATKVDVEQPRRQTIRRNIETIGRLEALESVPIHAKVSGYVDKISVDIGSKVKKGENLAEILAPELVADLEEKKSSVKQADAKVVQARAGVTVAKAMLSSAEARVGQAKAGLRRAEADAARWRSEYARTKQLAADRAVTQSVLDESQSKLESAEAALDNDRAAQISAEAAVGEARALLAKAEADVIAADSGTELARAELNHAQAMLDYTKILAPFDGTVTLRGVDTGQLTIAGPQGKPLFEVVRVEKVTAVLMFPETSAQLVAEGKPAEIRFPSLQNRVLKGTVTRIARAVDPLNGTSRVEVDLPNPDGSLNPGLYVRATVVVEEHTGTITVPATAVIRNMSQAFVACVESGKLVRKPIELGIEDGTRSEVLKGLTGTETVIKENGAALAVGQSVEVQASAQSTKSAGSP